MPKAKMPKHFNVYSENMVEKLASRLTNSYDKLQKLFPE